MGVKILENLPVLDVIVKNGKACGVKTLEGEIKAEVVVLCPGMWGYEMGNKIGVNIPLQAAEHYYLISEPIPEVHNKLPILRDPGRCAYAREEAGKILLGFFEPNAAPWSEKSIPENFCFDEIQPDWDRMEPHIETGMQRIPKLFDTGIRQFFCGPESFTPDHNYLMGRAPFIKDLFVACGFNSLGILSGGGAGFVIAQWINDGIQPMDIWDVDIRRIPSCFNNKSFIVDRTKESLGIAYQMHWPNRQWETARGMKHSILHDRLSKAGACFGESAGWERPNWYAFQNQEAKYDYDFNKQNWFENNKAEHTAVRTAVGMFEQTSFSKFLVQGKDATNLLNRIATANLDVEIGRVVYTQFLNKKGGVEADLTITRINENEFLIVTAAFTATHVEAWIRENIEEGDHCFIVDISGAYSMLNLQGPNARDLLSNLSSTDFSNSSFPFGTMQRIEIGYQNALAVRISYTGELGWELYIPTEMTLGIYDRILEEGKNFGLTHCGYHALNSLRIEKAYREWAHDMGPTDTLKECGLAFTCDWNKTGGFIGQEALESQSSPLSRKLVQFVLKDPEPILNHNEPILRNGELVGYTVSSGYGHTIGACVAMAYVSNKEGITDEYLTDAQYEIEQANRLYRADLSLKPLYDPKSERARS